MSVVVETGRSGTARGSGQHEGIYDRGPIDLRGVSRTSRRRPAAVRVSKKSMPSFRGFAFVLVSGLSICSAVPASAFDGSEPPADEKSNLSIFKTPSQAFRQGMDGYRSGNLK